MKRAILTGVALIAAGAAVFFLAGEDGVCPDECPGQHCMNRGTHCLIIGSDGVPVRVQDGAPVTDVNALPADQRKRMVGCCDADGNESVAWLAVSEGMPSGCMQLTTPGLHPAISMTNVDMGHALKLNQACCARDVGPVTPGNWGQCPHCAFKCQGGQAVPDPTGCDAFCTPGE